MTGIACATGVRPFLYYHSQIETRAKSKGVQKSETPAKPNLLQKILHAKENCSDLPHCLLKPAPPDIRPTAPADTRTECYTPSIRPLHYSSWLEAMPKRKPKKNVLVTLKVECLVANNSGGKSLIF